MAKQVFGVLVVEPDEIMCNALLTFLDSHEDFKVAGSAVNAQEAIHLCQTLKPDILLIEFSLPDMGGIEAIRQLHQHCPLAPIVVLTGSVWSDHMAEAVEAGVTGWLEKGMSPDTLTEALRLAALKTRNRQP